MNTCRLRAVVWGSGVATHSVGHCRAGAGAADPLVLQKKCKRYACFITVPLIPPPGKREKKKKN